MSRVNNGEFFYIVRPNDTLAGIVGEVFKTQSSSEHGWRLGEMLARNPHMENPDHIRPGMFLSTGIAPNPVCTVQHSPSELMQMEQIWQSVPEDHKIAITENWDLLSALDLPDLGFELGKNSVGSVAKHVGNVASSLIPPAVVVSIVEQDVVQLVEKTFLRVRRDSIQMIQSLQLSVSQQKLLFIEVDVAGFAAHSRKLERYAKHVKYLKYGGYAFTAGDLLYTAKKVNDAWGTPEQDRVIVQSALSKAGSFAGGAVSYLACNAIFGTLSLGSSLFWCGVVASTAGGVGGGMVGEAVSDNLFYGRALSPAPLP